MNYEELCKELRENLPNWLSYLNGVPYIFLNFHFYEDAHDDSAHQAVELVNKRKLIDLTYQEGGLIYNSMMNECNPIDSAHKAGVLGYNFMINERDLIDLAHQTGVLIDERKFLNLFDQAAELVHENGVFYDLIKNNTASNPTLLEIVEPIYNLHNKVSDFSKEVNSICSTANNKVFDEIEKLMMINSKEEEKWDEYSKEMQELIKQTENENSYKIKKLRYVKEQMMLVEESIAAQIEQDEKDSQKLEHLNEKIKYEEMKLVDKKQLCEDSNAALEKSREEVEKKESELHRLEQETKNKNDELKKQKIEILDQNQFLEGLEKQILYQRNKLERLQKQINLNQQSLQSKEQQESELQRIIQQNEKKEDNIIAEQEKVQYIEKEAENSLLIIKQSEIIKELEEKLSFLEQEKQYKESICKNETQINDLQHCLLKELEDETIKPASSDDSLNSIGEIEQDSDKNNYEEEHYIYDIVGHKNLFEEATEQKQATANSETQTPKEHKEYKRAMHYMVYFTIPFALTGISLTTIALAELAENNTTLLSVGLSFTILSIVYCFVAVMLYEHYSQKSEEFSGHILESSVDAASVMESGNNVALG